MTQRNVRGTRYGWTWLLLVGALAPAALAGGTPEEALLIIDPTRTDAMYVANYYLNARDIPSVNVLYMDPTAPNYPTFAADNVDALFGALANLGIRDHIDYLIMPPASSFYVSAPGLVSDGCSPVNRFSLTSAYILSYYTSGILAGNMTSTKANRYFGGDNTPYGFDSMTRWKNGEPIYDGTGHIYFIGAYLGYTGERGNTVDEIIANIDRSVAVDGTFPTGTFYYMHTTDDNRSAPRHGYYPTAVDDIIDLGGNAELLFAVLPTGNYDCLGIMTGWASPDIEGADMTILPGAICDHLTSYAAKFDTSSQTKISSWIRTGASGSWGAVEEPCNYAGKFPHPRVHVYYYQGLSLGEALFRSIGFLPFQGLLYGDPLTRPFAYLPDVQVPDAPTGTVSGTISLSPEATTTHPTAQIAQFDLLIDGLLHSSIAPGEQFEVNTNALSDGRHDLRVLASDDTYQRFTGRWVGTLTTDNRTRSATLEVTPASGDWNTEFDATLGAVGTGVDETRLLHNGRVVAAAPGASVQLAVYGLTLGAGPVSVQAEALFTDGEHVRSEPFDLEIAYSGDTPSGLPPVAFDYTKYVLSNETFVVELPATFDDPNTALTYELLSDPVQATVVAGDGPYRIMRLAEPAEGTDSFTFQVNSAVGSSNVATVTLVYVPWCIGDLDGDGQVNLSDLAQLLGHYGSTDATYGDGDIHPPPSGDGDVDLGDLAELVGRYGNICE
jgi:hypothetical protein